MVFFTVLIIILFAPIVMSKLRIPHIIGMVLAGVLIGPYGLNVLERDASFELFGKVGLLYIMFLAGLEMDMDAQDWSTNSYDPASLFTLQDAGAVFLPNDGYRVELKVNDIDPVTYRGLNGYYWTTTESGTTNAQSVCLTKTGPEFNASPRSQGMNVRLVKDAGAPVGIKDVAAPAKDNIIRKVLINGKFYIMQGDNLFNAQGARIR